MNGEKTPIDDHIEIMKMPGSSDKTFKVSNKYFKSSLVLSTLETFLFLSLGKEIESDCFACLVWYKAESNRNARTKNPPITLNLKLSGQSQQ